MKKEAAIVVDTLFAFNGHRILLETMPPMKSDEDLEKEIKDFRDNFWNAIGELPARGEGN